MRRSPMAGGGGVVSGRGLMKTVHKAVRAGSGSHGSFQEPFTTSGPSYKHSSSENNSNYLSFLSGHHYSPFSSINHLNRSTSSSTMNDQEFDDYVFCTVPSTNEVNHALSSLQHVLDPRTSSHETGCEFDWIEPSASMLQYRGFQSVYDAFHLLQTEPSVKKMVMSLSSDISVWDAVMNNEAVLELRNSIKEANNDTESSSDGSILVSDVINWVFINTKAKMMELVEKTVEMVNKLFQSSRNENKAKEEDAATEPIEKKLRSSFLLTVMVLLIVVMTRSSRSY